MVDISTISGIIQLSTSGGYFITLLIMMIAGPIGITAASFAASLGYFDIFIITALALLGDVIGDVLVYIIGYYTRKKILMNYNHIFKIKSSWIENIEGLFKRHLGKTMWLIKLSPLAVPGLILAGASKVNIKKYAFWCTVILIPKTLFFVILGYSFGTLANSVLGYYKDTSYALLFIIIFSATVYFLYRKVSEKILKSSRINIKNQA